MRKKKLRRDAVVCFSAHARELEFREARRDGKSCAALLWHATCEAKRMLGMAKRRSSSLYIQESKGVILGVVTVEVVEVAPGIAANRGNEGDLRPC